MDGLTRRATLLAFTCVSAAAFAASVVWVRDPDMFHHLAYGRELARTGGFPATEPFLYPLAGVPEGPPPFWLGSLAIYAWHALFGDGGLAFLPATVGALLFAVLLADSAPRNGRHHSWMTLASAALPLTLALEAFRARATARPELFALVFVAATAWAARRFEDGRPRMLLAFPLLALVWSNVHPSVVVGLGIAGLLACTTPFTAPPDERRRAVLATVLVTVLGAATTFANPSAVHPIVEAVRFAATALGLREPAPGLGADPLSTIQALVVEMRRPGLDLLTTPAGILLGLTGATFVLRWRGARIRELLTVAAFAVLAFGAERFAVFVALVCAPIAARNLGEIVAAVPERLRRVPARTAAAVAVAAAASLHPALAQGSPQISFGTGLWRRMYPIRAADYLLSIGFDGRLFNTFHVGGYLEWREVRSVYQDGRGGALPGLLEASIVGPNDPETFAQLDERFRFDALVLAYPKLSPERIEALRALGDRDWLVDRDRWALVAFDDGGLVYLRRDGKYAGIAARDEYALARPANPGVRGHGRAELPAVLAEYRRSVAETPSCMRCRLKLAAFELSAGDPAEATRVLAPVLGDAQRELPELVLLAGHAAAAEGRLDAARAQYVRYLSVEREDPGARRALARVALAAGDPRAAEKALRPNLAAAQPHPEDLQLAAHLASALRGR